MLPKSRYVSPRLDGHCGAYAYCDRTGFQVMHSDLRKQMTYAGDNLVWTGLMVHKDFLDVLNPQSLPYKTKNDPQIVKNARPYQQQPSS